MSTSPRQELTNQQQRELGAEFDRQAGIVTALFNRIQQQPVITMADYNQANLALGALAQVATDYSYIEYISRQWNSAAYKPAYERRLQQIRAAVANPSPGSLPPDTTTGGPVFPGGGSSVPVPVPGGTNVNNLVIVGGLGILAYLLFFRN